MKPRMVNPEVYIAAVTLVAALGLLNIADFTTLLDSVAKEVAQVSVATAATGHPRATPAPGPTTPPAHLYIFFLFVATYGVFFITLIIAAIPLRDIVSGHAVAIAGDRSARLLVIPLGCAVFSHVLMFALALARFKTEFVPLALRVFSASQ